MLLLVPYLFPPARLLEGARGLRLPALETLLARGTRESSRAEGVEAALCEALGVSRQQDWPLAPITLAADGDEAGDAYWLRADPVHLRVMRDRIVLTDSESVSLTHDEADTLAEAIGQHFGDELKPLALHPQRWYLRFRCAPRLTTTPLSVAVGRDVAPLLPQGEDALRFRARLNELQMLLHEHPVNQARESRGDLPVNSLWLWGGGCLPLRPVEPKRPLFAVNAEAQALGAFCDTPAHTPPTHPDVRLLKTDGVVLLDALTRSGQVGDAHGWRQALAELERDWFVPLRSMVRQIGAQGLRLADPVGGRAVQLKAGDAWCVWRRSSGLAAMLA